MAEPKRTGSYAVLTARLPFFVFLLQNAICLCYNGHIKNKGGDPRMHTVGIYDRYNFDQERLKRASELYLGRGEGLDRPIPLIHR